jgi:hypothetical protein
MARVVASSLLTPTLAQNASSLEILGVGATLIWLAVDGQAVTIQSKDPGSPLALPTSIFVAEKLDALASRISLIDGHLALANQPIQVMRWWQPPRAPLAPVAAPLGQAPQVARLLGRGSGLTPEGDDILAGWLVMARSIAHPDFETVLAEVSRVAKARTTTFSAALLDWAGAGYGVLPLIEYVNSRLQNSESISSRRDLLTRVGHTSGEALAIGVDMALGLVNSALPFIEFGNQERAIA